MFNFEWQIIGKLGQWVKLLDSPHLAEINDGTVCDGVGLLAVSAYQRKCSDNMW